MSSTSFLKVTSDYISNNNNQIRSKDSRSYLAMSLDKDGANQVSRAIIESTNNGHHVGINPFGGSDEVQSHTLCFA